MRRGLAVIYSTERIGCLRGTARAYRTPTEGEVTFLADKPLALHSLKLSKEIPAVQFGDLL